jgi:MFS family permease
MMLIGALPALLTFFIRLFVPESRRWQEEKQKGSTGSWAARDLLGVLVGCAGPAFIIYLWANPELDLSLRIGGSIVGFIVALAGYTYPVLGYLRRDAARSPEASHTNRGTIGLMLLGAALSGVALLGTWASAQWAAYWADQLAAPGARAKEWTQMWSAGGAIVGTMLAALAGDWLGRRVTYTLLCLTSIVSIALLYLGNQSYGTGYLASAFLVGVCTASFYGWLPLYLPELFRTSVRATGQGFSFNFGRILAAIGALQAGNLMNSVFKKDVEIWGEMYKGCPVACTSMSAIYLVGVVLIWFAPETKGRPLPE